jgi:hypothetical protein
MTLYDADAVMDAVCVMVTVVPAASRAIVAIGIVTDAVA